MKTVLNSLLEKYEADECVRNRPIARQIASDTSTISRCISGCISGYLRGSATEMKPFEDSCKRVLVFGIPIYLFFFFLLNHFFVWGVESSSVSNLYVRDAL